MLISNNFSPVYNEGIAVYLQTPVRRLVNLVLDTRNIEDEAEGDEEGYRGNFFLSFPHVFFRLRYNKTGEKFERFGFVSLKVAFGTSPKMKKLYMPPLPNISEDLEVCLDYSPKRKTLDELCKECVASFWRSTFTDDILAMYDGEDYYYRLDSLLGDHRKWQKKTKKDPKWIPSARSLVLWGDFDKKEFLGESFIKSGFPLDEDDEDDDDY
jgi:hypothetical protein